MSYLNSLRETPIRVYSDHPQAELPVNGKLIGKCTHTQTGMV
ncbi:DUF4982 domain-containing protein [Paraburkholderia sediminicola]